MIRTLKDFTSRNINPTLLHLAHEYKNTIGYTIGLCILLAFLITAVSIHTGGHHSITKIQGNHNQYIFSQLVQVVICRNEMIFNLLHLLHKNLSS